MLRRNSQPVVSANPFTLLSLSPEQKKLAAEKEKVLAYITARMILGKARGEAYKSDEYKFGSQTFWCDSERMVPHLQGRLATFDVLLHEFPEPVFYAYLTENVSEILDIFTIQVNQKEIEKYFQDFVDGSRAAFQSEIKEKMQFRDMLQNTDVVCVAETVLSFIKCGASLSLRTMLHNMHEADRNKLISSLGQRMLHCAIQFRQVAIVKELLQYNMDLNLAYDGIMMTSEGAMPSECGPKSALAHALDRALADYSEIDKDNNKIYEDLKKFFATSKYLNYEMPPFQEIDIASIAKADEEIIFLMLAHDIHPDNLRGIVATCTQIKTWLMSPDSYSATPLRWRSEVTALIDKIIAGVSLRADICSKVS